jgi:hypothetical protein
VDLPLEEAGLFAHKESTNPIEGEMAIVARSGFDVFDPRPLDCQSPGR